MGYFNFEYLRFPQPTVHCPLALHTAPLHLGLCTCTTQNASTVKLTLAVPLNTRSCALTPSQTLSSPSKHNTCQQSQLPNTSC